MEIYIYDNITNMKSTARNTAAQKFPLEYLCGYANAVLERESANYWNIGMSSSNQSTKMCGASHLAMKSGDWLKESVVAPEQLIDFFLSRKTRYHRIDPKMICTGGSYAIMVVRRLKSIKQD